MKTKERIKTILLVVLLLGAAFLTYMIWGSYTGKQNTEVVEGDGVTVASENVNAGVIPFTVSYKTAGVRYGAMYNENSVGNVYEKAAPILKSAFSSLEKAEKAEADEWEKALLKDGVIVDYEGNIPIDILCGELGVFGSNYGMCARYVLVCDDRIYLKNSDSNMCYRIESELDGEKIADMLTGISAERCNLAAEVRETRVSPETILFEGKISCHTIASENAAELLNDSQMFNLLKVFGINYNTCGRHMESDGSRTYVQGLSTVKILPDGYMIYETEGMGEEITLTVYAEKEIPTFAEQVEGANSILQTLQSIMGDECKLYVRDMDGESIKYGRSFGGIPVDISGNGYSAEVEFSGNGITKLAFSLRNYKGQGSVSYVLPQKIAVASAGKAKGRILSLRYVDTLQGGMDAQWFFKALEKKKK